MPPHAWRSARGMGLCRPFPQGIRMCRRSSSAFASWPARIRMVRRGWTRPRLPAWTSFSPARVVWAWARLAWTLGRTTSFRQTCRRRRLGASWPLLASTGCPSSCTSETIRRLRTTRRTSLPPGCLPRRACPPPAVTCTASRTASRSWLPLSSLAVTLPLAVRPRSSAPMIFAMPPLPARRSSSSPRQTVPTWPRAASR